MARSHGPSDSRLRSRNCPGAASLGCSTNESMEYPFVMNIYSICISRGFSRVAMISLSFAIARQDSFLRSGDLMGRKECTRPFAPELEHVCGRPLGLRFDKKTGHLYIADAYFGLMVMGPDGGLATLVAKEAEGEPFRFTNDLDIDESEDVIYFTDSSTTFHRRQILSAFLSGNKTGRLMKYDKSSKGPKVLLRGLAFPNGVALSKDGLFLLVAESATGQILRLWLKGPNARKFDIFAELPGYPDNIRRNFRGEFWVALHAKKEPVLRFLLSNSLIGNFALRLPISLQQLHLSLVGGEAEATALKLGKEGEILEVVKDKEGKTVQFISEVEERDNKLWMGSVMRPFIGIYDMN